MESKRLAARLFFMLITVVFAVELGIMLSLGSALSALTPLSVGLVDSLMLTALLFPVLYVLVFRPLVKLVAEREEAEQSLKKAYGTVEAQVEERTLELAKANDRLKDEAGKRETAKDLSDTLNTIAGTLGSTFNLDRVVGEILPHATGKVGCDASAIIWREKEDRVVSHTFGLPELKPGERVAEQKMKDFHTVLETKGLFVCEDAFADERIPHRFVEKLGVHSFISAPLAVKGELIGVLDFYRLGAGGAFTDAEIDFVNKLATSISMALESARLYATERNIADTLQEALLILPEEIAGLEFSHLYRSAEAAAKAGGDFYDLFELEHDKIGIIVGDVSGKGLEAATLTSLIKNTIVAYAYRNSPPAEIVKLTNTALLKRGSSSPFVTVFFGILEKTSGLLTYCAAGHPAPVLYRRGQQAVLLEVVSPAIGIFAEFEYADQRAQMNDEDVLLLYTDGVTEARRGRDLFGEKALLAFVNSLDKPLARDMPARILAELQKRNFTLPDDIAMLALALENN